MRCAGLVLLCAAALMAEGRPPREIAFEGRLSMPARLADGRLISLYAEMRPFTEMEKENAVTPV